jgi:AcrR family transcriptional regulator
MADLIALEARSADILMKTKSAFAEKGFDGASMQDLARSAGMSVGNFYRYFPSKAAIVEGFISIDIAEMHQEFADVFDAPEPMKRLREIIHRRIPMHRANKDGCLWAEITAVALRKPEIAASACRMEESITKSLIAVFALHTGMPFQTAQTTFATHASFIVLLFKSATMIGPHIGSSHDDLTAMVVRTIDQTLDTISSYRSEGL